MPDTSDYEFKGYYDDDAKMIHDILEKNWDEDVLKDKLLFYYDETKDITSVNYNTGEIAIKIYADEVDSSPRGIGFDSLERDRRIRIHIRTLDRDLFLGVIDEIARIMTKYRLRPGNAWDTLWIDSYEPIYPSEKFFQGLFTIHVKQYCHTIPIPRENWHSDTYY